MVTLCRGSAGVRFHRRDLWDLPLMRRILRIALPTAAQRLSHLAAAGAPDYRVWRSGVDGLGL